MFDDRGVSQALDFVVVFGMITVTVGLIAAVGYPMLKGIQDSTHMENTKNSMAALASNINTIAFDSAPSRSTEFRLSGESLSVDTASTMTVNLTVWNSTSPQNISLGPFRLATVSVRKDATSIAYESTGLWRRYLQGSLLLEPPLIKTTEGSLVIPVITTDSTPSVGGSGIVRLEAKAINTTLYHYSNVSSVDIRIDGPLRNEWLGYLGSMAENYDPPSNINVYIMRSEIGFKIV